MASLAGAAAGMAAVTAGAATTVAGTAAVALGSVGCLVVKELSSQAFALTLGHLSDILSYLTRRSDDATRVICEELTKIVPTAKLKIIQCVLFDFEWLREESKTINSLCERLTELAQSIHFHIQQIGLTIDAFNQLYFRSWRTLDVSLHLQVVRQNVHDVHETFELLKLMLPSCISLMQSSIRKLQKLKSSSAGTAVATTAPLTTTTTNTTDATNATPNPCTALVLSNSWIALQ